MDQNSELQRGFFNLRESWYSRPVMFDKNITDELVLGLYYENGGGYEMSIVWKDIGMGRSVAQLRAFDDSWKVLASFGDLIAKLAEYDNANINVQEMMEVLKSLGFVDKTNRVNPNPTHLQQQYLVTLNFKDVPEDVIIDVDDVERIIENVLDETRLYGRFTELGINGEKTRCISVEVKHEADCR